MAARARKQGELYQEYKDALKTEDYDLKLRLRLGPARYRAFQEYMASRSINLDEVKDESKPDRQRKTEESDVTDGSEGT